VVERFTSKYQELLEGMNLVEMRPTGTLKAYVCDFNNEINATPKMVEFMKEMHFLMWVAKVNGGCLVQISKAF
jgi:hypothetical protein